MRTSLDVHQALLARGVRHEVVRLPRTATSADELPQLLGVDPRDCVAVRCYRVEGARSPVDGVAHLAAVVVRAGDVPEDDQVRRVLSAASARRAAPEEVSRHTDFAAALVCPLGLPEDVLVLADSRLAEGSGDGPVRWCATGDGGTAIGVTVRDLLVHSGARVATLALPDDPVVLDGPLIGLDWRPSPGRVIPLDAARRRPARDTRRTAG